MLLHPSVSVAPVGARVEEQLDAVRAKRLGDGVLGHPSLVHGQPVQEKLHARMEIYYNLPRKYK